MAELHSYHILNTPSEREFDEIADLAAYIAAVPMAYIAFLDDARQWFKSTHGFSDPGVVPRDATFCHFVVLDEEAVVLPDTREETARVPAGGIPRITLAGAEAEEEIRFYLGVPIRSTDGFVLGTLCSIDTKPHAVTRELPEMMQRLANQVGAQLELRRSNALLFEERDTFSTLFEAAPAPLLLVLDGHIVRANYAFSDMVSDHDAAWLERKEVRRFIPELPAGSDAPVQTWVQTEPGGSIPVMVKTTSLRTGRRDYQLVTVLDISDRVEKERVLWEQQKKAENAARIKDMFLSLVSHDLKSPLSGIFMMLDLMAKSGESFSKEEREQTIRDLRSSAAVLVEMINQLLNIHRLQTGHVEVHPEIVATASVCEQVILTLRTQIDEKAIAIVKAIPEDHRCVADPGLIREALFNLLSNAVKFTPQGGTIRVCATGPEIAVQDSGTGVPAEDRADLFRHEIKTSRAGTDGERGTGLGLPLVADIMEAHGGEVFLDESYTDGARFVLRLPAR